MSSFRVAKARRVSFGKDTVEGIPSTQNEGDDPKAAGDHANVFGNGASSPKPILIGNWVPASQGQVVVYDYRIVDLHEEILRKIGPDVSHERAHKSNREPAE